MQTSTREAFRRGLKRHGRQTKCEAHETSQRTTQAMTRKPQVGIWILRCDIEINVQCRMVIMVFGGNLVFETG